MMTSVRERERMRTWRTLPSRGVPWSQCSQGKRNFVQDCWKNICSLGWVRARGGFQEKGWRSSCIRWQEPDDRDKHRRRYRGEKQRVATLGIAFRAPAISLCCSKGPLYNSYITFPSIHTSMVWGDDRWILRNNCYHWRFNRVVLLGPSPLGHFGWFILLR